MQGNLAYKKGINAYQQVERETLSPRETEARVLRKAAQKLRICRENWELLDSGDRREKLEEAFEYNHRIWSLFQAELSRSDHPMDRDLRQNILNLSIFIEKQIFDIRLNNYGQPDKLESIININNSIASGLAKQAASPLNSQN